MAPRGRHTKTRTSRIDAAIDAMAPFGFTAEVVIAKMRQLLKEYGGQDGYGFIELDAYCVLLEALLADQDKGNCREQKQEQVTGETSKMIIDGEKAGFIDIPVCSSTPVTDLPPPPPPSTQPPVVSLPPPPPIVEVVPQLPPVPSVADVVLPPPETAQPQRRKPCHGWISNEDKDWRFITLPPSINGSISPPITRPIQPAESELTGGRKNRPKRRSRWDLMPDDM